jgi:hypothetical protein
MPENPPRSTSMSLCVLLASIAIAIASPAFANQPSDEQVAAMSDLAPKPALDGASDLSAIEDFERQRDRELTADVSRMLDAIVVDRTDRHMRWLAQNYFDGAAVRGSAAPGAPPASVASPTSTRSP